ncbi:MAG TPA: caspase family protein [Terracidiphilus sp.]
MFALAGLALLRLDGVGEQAEDAHVPWLSLPDIDGRVSGNDTAEFSKLPDSVQAMVVHIPAGGPHINYGTIHTKVNTESADIATKSTSSSDGFELKVDLTAAGGFRFQPGRNSVELEYQDQFGRQKYFNFLITFQGQPAERGIILETPNRPPEKRAAKLYAVVIGISRYDQFGSTIGNLKFADRDAMGFLDFLKSASGGGLSDDAVTVLLNEKATTQNVRHALFTFLTAAQPQDTVVIYIAGHGAQDPHDPRNLYLLTADSKPDDMGGTAFPMWQMQDVFERVLKAKRVITIADTCHSFGFSGVRGGDKRRGNNLINQYLQRYAARGARAVITASDISEPSFEDAQWGDGHGVFTYYLLKGLKGEADRNHDGVVTAGELFAYLRRVVPEATGGKQNPRAMEGLASALPVSILRVSPVNSHPKVAMNNGIAH